MIELLSVVSLDLDSFRGPWNRTHHGSWRIKKCGCEDPSPLRHTCIATLCRSKICGTIQIPIEKVLKSE